VNALRVRAISGLPENLIWIMPAEGIGKFHRKPHALAWAFCFGGVSRNSAAPDMMCRKKEATMFANVGEAGVTRAITGEFAKWFEEHISSDVIIVGGGPSGLVAARDIAKAVLRRSLSRATTILAAGFG